MALHTTGLQVHGTCCARPHKIRYSAIPGCPRVRIERTYSSMKLLYSSCLIRRSSRKPECTDLRRRKPLGISGKFLSSILRLQPQEGWCMSR